MKNIKIKKNFLSEIAYKKIKELILAGEIRGEKIDQGKLATDLGISKMPVLIALHQLEVDGYLEKIPNKGFYLRKYSKEDFYDLQEIRIMFEMWGVEKLIKNITEETKDTLIKYYDKFESFIKNKDIGKYRSLDEDFHRYLTEKCDNKIILKLYKQFNVMISSLVKSHIPIELSLKQHKKIIDSILAEDIEKSKALLKEHIKTLYKYLANSE
jgi:DNA-binding GntR family transcriptional regulator